MEQIKTPELAKLELLCLEAAKACRENYTTEYYEPYFIRVLEHIKSCANFRSEFSEALIKMIELHDDDVCPWELIPFCMHELRWTEVRRGMERILKNSKNVHIKTVMSHIIEGFSDKWENTDLYYYYSRKE